VVIAAVAGVVIGFIWYLPQVFGTRWAAEGGIQLPSSGEVSPLIYLGSVVQALIQAYVVGLFAGGAGVVNGAIIGFVLWLVLAAATYSAVIYERKSWMYWAINAGYSLVSLLVMGAIVGFFPARM
jgi:hypothetical protein